jgi:heme/copper-type cytochrome/quinol oxidase subunit 1
MNRQLEIRWLIFLSVILVVSLGFQTGFRFDESIDIQLHDTYYVIHNTHLIISTCFLVVAAYLISLGLKRLSKVNNRMKLVSTIITGLIAFLFSALSILILSILLTTSIKGQNISNYGLLILFLGLGILFIVRLIQIWRTK